MTDPVSLAARVAFIVRAAIVALAMLEAKRLAPPPVLVAIRDCWQAKLRRFERLMARIAAGKPAVVRPTREAVAGRRGMRRPSLVPRGHVWAVKMSQETASFGSQLHALLSEPDVAELLRLNPKAGAILRPLLRAMAGPMPDVLQPAGPPPPKVRRAPRPDWPPGNAQWPGVKAWRARWAATLARANQPQPPWRPLRRGYW